MRNSLYLIVAGLVAGPICALAAGSPGQSAVEASPPTVAIAASDAAIAAPDLSAAASPSFAALAAKCAPSIHVRTLSSLVRQESRLNPYAININGGKKLARQPSNAAEAVATAQSLLDQGDNIDVGLGQINSNNFARLGVSLSDLFEPCTNLQAAAKVLQDCYERGVAANGEGQEALHAALSCYNTGSLSNGIKNGYVRAVVAQAKLPVPELLPLASGGETNAPVPLRANRAAGAPTTQGAAPSEVVKVVKRSGEPDVFTASADDDAFSATPDKQGGSQ